MLIQLTKIAIDHFDRAKILFLQEPNELVITRSYKYPILEYCEVKLYISSPSRSLTLTDFCSRFWVLGGGGRRDIKGQTERRHTSVIIEQGDRRSQCHLRAVKSNVWVVAQVII